MTRKAPTLDRLGTRPTFVPESPARGWALVVKVGLMALVDALGIFLVLRFVTNDQPIIAAAVAIALVIINIVYFRAGNLPAKYIIPGLIFLLVFQIFVICFSVFVSLTNYGAGHNIEKPAAVEAIQANSVARVPGSQAYPVTILEKEGELYLLATAPNGEALLGSATVPLAPAPDAVFDGDQAKGIPGYTTLNLGDLLRQQEAVTGLQVPMGRSAEDGYLKTVNGVKAYTFTSTLVYSPETDTMRDVVTGTEYVDNGEGNFESTDGDTLQPGWKTFVGLQNYATAVGAGGQTDIIGVVVWTFVFALMSVFLSFSVGTLLALVFNDARLRGRRVYRLVMILPYAFPVFLTGLIWSGLLNQQYGFINEVLLGGAQIPWLQDEWRSLLFPRVHRSSAVHPRGRRPGCTDGWRLPVAAVSAHQAAVAARGGQPSAHCFIRLQLQRLHHHFHAERWRAREPGITDRSRRDRHPHYCRVQARLPGRFEGLWTG